MKNLFVSFTCKDSDRLFASGNIVIDYHDKIACSEDITSLSEYIEMRYGLTDVIIGNFRRME